jgi:hypothetical protein
MFGTFHNVLTFYCLALAPLAPARSNVQKRNGIVLAVMGDKRRFAGRLLTV